MRLRSKGRLKTCSESYVSCDAGLLQWESKGYLLLK